MPQKKSTSNNKNVKTDSLFERHNAIRDAIHLVFSKSDWELEKVCKVITLNGSFQECVINLDGEKKIKNSKNKAFTITSRVDYKENLYGVLTAHLPEGREKTDEEEFIVQEAANDIAVELFFSGLNKNMIELRTKLQKTRSLSKAIFETTGTAMLMVDDTSMVISSNDEFAKLSGYLNEEIDGKLSWKDFISGDDVKKMIRHQKLRSIDPASAPRNYEFRFVDRHGIVKDIYGTFNQIPETNIIIGAFMDITSQKKLESEIIRTSEQERQRIGNDLHDGLGPHLVGVKFMANTLEKKLSGRNLEHEVKDIREIDTLLTQGINQIRRLVKGLCPVDIDVEGLIVALEDLTMNTQRVYGVKCSFEHDESLLLTDNIAATHLYLIAQESVNNAIKHSKATVISLTIAKDSPGIVVMDISDNGIGFKKLLDSDSGVGINIMKYRARLINASIDIRRNDLGGTSVQCFINMQGDKSTALKGKKRLKKEPVYEYNGQDQNTSR